MSSSRFRMVLFVVANLRTFLMAAAKRHDGQTRTRAVRWLLGKCAGVEGVDRLKEFLQEILADTIFEASADWLLSAQDVLQHRCDYEEAAAAYAAILDSHRGGRADRLCLTLYRLAICYCRLDRFQEAIQCLREAMDRTERPEARQALGRVLASCGRLLELSPGEGLWPFLSRLQGDASPASDSDRETCEMIEEALEGLRSST